MVQVALEVALPFDLFDDRGVEAHPGVEQEVATVDAADPDRSKQVGFDRSQRERHRFEGVVG